MDSSKTPVTKGQLRELKKLLKTESHRWFQLGFQMRVSMDDLKKIEKESARNSPDKCFLDVIGIALKEERKWKDIFDALEDVNKNRLKRQLEERYKPGDKVSEDVTEAAELVNLLADVTPDWFMFGQSLDISVPDLRKLRDDKGPDVCLAQMIEVWFEGDSKSPKRATIETVIAALEALGNRLLARKVQESFLTTKKQEEPKEITWLDNIDTTPLSSVENTFDVVEALGADVVNWEDLGIALKIKDPKLEEIKVNNRGQVKDCRREVIRAWLKNGDATWEALCIALAKEFVGHINLAKKIADQHRVGQASTPHDPNAFSSHPQGSTSVFTKEEVVLSQPMQVQDKSTSDRDVIFSRAVAMDSSEQKQLLQNVQQQKHYSKPQLQCSQPTARGQMSQPESESLQTAAYCRSLHSNEGEHDMEISRNVQT